jgi:HAD superfamily hydrolase (TIGR01509 family)
MGDLYGLIFDVDGVIADTEAVNARASIQMFEDLFGLMGVKRADFEAGLGRGAEAYVLAAANAYHFEMSPDQVAQATEARQEYFLRMLAEEPLPPFPGVLELMHAAMARDDFCVGIATSSTKEKSEAVLKSAGIPYDQMAYINGSDVTRKKPDPQLFLLCAERMGVPSERCVVIENAPDGVEAAKTAGSKCIAVTNSTTANRLAKADRVVDSLAEVDIEAVVEMLP